MTLCFRRCFCDAILFLFTAIPWNALLSRVVTVVIIYDFYHLTTCLAENGVWPHTFHKGRPILDANAGDSWSKSLGSQLISSYVIFSHNPGLRLLAVTRRQALRYLTSYSASPSFGQYQITLLGDKRHMRVNLPRVVTWQQNSQTW